MSLGVYVHFPYCLSACPYCDFAFTVARRGRGIPHRAYADAVLAELAARAGAFAGRGELISVYFGGGTPGLWEPAALGAVLDAIRSGFAGPDPEVTIEVNPADERLHTGGLDALARAGVNRLSVGAQSTDDRTLRRLGRMHRAGDVARTLAAARAAGFARLSLDLIVGAPGQDLAAVLGELERARALGPDHLSVYSLGVEPGTVFARRAARGTLRAPGADDVATLLEAAWSRLAGAGFEHYEISNFARPGARSRHNELYWTGGAWLGLGASACSSVGTADGGVERWQNRRDAAGYLAAPADAVESRERLDPAAAAREAAWLGLRRVADGIPEGALADRAAEVERLCAAGLLERAAGRLRLTRRGALLGDEVCARLL